MLAAELRRDPEGHRRADDRPSGRRSATRSSRRSTSSCCAAAARSSSSIRNVGDRAGRRQSLPAAAEPGLVRPAEAVPGLGHRLSIRRRSSRDRALAQRVQVARSARTRSRSIRSGCILTPTISTDKDPVTANLQIAQSRQRRRAASAQGRDDDLHAAGDVRPTKPSLLDADRCAEDDAGPAGL